MDDTMTMTSNRRLQEEIVLEDDTLLLTGAPSTSRTPYWTVTDLTQDGVVRVSWRSGRPRARMSTFISSIAVHRPRSSRCYFDLSAPSSTFFGSDPGFLSTDAALIVDLASIDSPLLFPFSRPDASHMIPTQVSNGSLSRHLYRTFQPSGYASGSRDDVSLTGRPLHAPSYQVASQWALPFCHLPAKALLTRDWKEKYLPTTSFYLSACPASVQAVGGSVSSLGALIRLLAEARLGLKTTTLRNERRLSTIRPSFFCHLVSVSASCLICERAFRFVLVPPRSCRSSIFPLLCDLQVVALDLQPSRTALFVAIERFFLPSGCA
ncbi:hypothetical protein R3P38DRAFT_3184105 [Favolaschia claudopus]|uniref:Uncharacterized protein n=1 Tax=Favolaschia claudopus TaxID=2862362 RepID=A0AAW0CBK2_9AGAR